jgi:death-on-curing protein
MHLETISHMSGPVYSGWLLSTLNGLTQNHDFVDGNKRVALTVAGVFLERNGFRLEAPEQEAVSATNALSAGTLSCDEFESWLEASCAPI